jgi:hypothetical protein
MTERILSFDVSGAATGWAYGFNGKLEDWGKFISKEHDPKGKRLADFAKWVCSILEAKKPTIVLVERPYRGRNSNVLVSLSKFIAIVEFCTYFTLELEIKGEWFIDPKVVKKTLKVPKGRDYDDNKRLMVKKINSLYNLNLKFNDKKSKSFNDDDTADAIGLLTAWWWKNDDTKSR